MPPPAVSDTDWPLQRIGAEGLAVMIGRGCTVTVTLAELVHPLPSVPNIISGRRRRIRRYSCSPVPEDNPVVDWYECTPPAVSDTDCPLQRTGAEGEAVMTGTG